MEYWIAFTIGFLGSLHCVGMCGPIAFALPLNRESNLSVWLGTATYNLGRIITYVSIGLLFGVLGYGVSLAGLQQSLSVVIGIGILFWLASKFIPSKRMTFSTTWSLLLGRLKAKLAQRFKSTSYQNLLGIGLLNGFLPCGLVYLGIAGSTSLASPLKAALFMAAFGLGTIPLMLAVSLFKANINPYIRTKFKQLRPVFLFIIASLFVLRGMNLGIPYISPDLQTNSIQSENCINPAIK